MSAPDVAHLPPAIQHAAVLQVLAELELANTVRYGPAWPGSRQQAAEQGRRRIVLRHAPTAAHLLCDRRCALWPCDDYRDAAAGAVEGLGT